MLLMNFVAKADPTPISETTKFLFEAAVAQASRAAEQALIQRLDLYMSLIGGVGAILVIVLGFVGFSQIRDIRIRLAENIKSDIENNLRSSMDFRAQIKLAVQQDVAEDLLKETGRLSTYIALLRLSRAVKDVNESEHFSDMQRDNLYDSLIKLKGNFEAESSPEFAEALELIISSFFQAQLFDHLKRIEGEFSEEINVSAKLTLSYVQMYSVIMFGDMYVDQEERDNVEDKLIHYCKVLKGLRYEEISLVERLALDVLKNDKRTPMGERILDSAMDLSAPDKANFIQALKVRLDPKNISRNPKSQHIRISTKFNRIFDLYGERIQEVEEGMEEED